MSISFPNVPVISVPMSYVCALIGKHQYKDLWYESINVFRRYNTPHRKPTLQDENESPLYKDLQTNHTSFFEKFINSVKIEHLQNEADTIVKDLCKKHKMPYYRHRMLLTKRRGYVLEKTALKIYAQQNKIEVLPVDKRIVFLSKEKTSFVSSNEGAYCRLVGQADGIDSLGRILEVKCRRSGFREFFFERVQLATYVIAYDKPGVLVEFYEGKLRCTDMSKDEAEKIWSNIFPAMIAWNNLVRHFMN